MKPWDMMRRMGVASAAVGAFDDELMADSPWAYYKLDESAGATSYADSSGNSRNLSNIVATITAGSSALCSPGTSVDFDGNGYISSTNNQYGAAQFGAFGGDRDVSIALVLECDSLAATVCALHLGNNSVNLSQGINLLISSTGAVQFQIRDTASNSYKTIQTSAGAILVGVPNLIHCRRAVGGAAKIEVNGVASASGSLSGNIAMNASSSSGGQRIMLGAVNAASPSNKLNGRLQHVAVFNSYVSDARVAAHAAACGL